MNQTDKSLMFEGEIRDDKGEHLYIRDKDIDLIFPQMWGLAGSSWIGKRVRLTVELMEE